MGEDSTEKPKNNVTPVEALNSIPDTQKTELINALSNRPPTFRDLAFSSRNLNDIDSEMNFVSRFNKGKREDKYDAAQLGHDTDREWTKNVNPLYAVDDSTSGSIVKSMMKIWPIGFVGYYTWNHFLTWKPVSGKKTWKKHWWPRVKYVGIRSFFYSTLFASVYASIQHYVLENYQPDTRKDHGITNKVFYRPSEIAESGFQVLLPNHIETKNDGSVRGLADKACNSSGKIRDTEIFRKNISDAEYERMMFSLSSGMIKSGHALNQSAYDKNRQHENAVKYWEDRGVGKKDEK